MRYLKLKLFELRLRIAIELLYFVCAVFRAMLRITGNTKYTNAIISALLDTHLKAFKYALILDKLRAEPN